MMSGDLSSEVVHCPNCEEDVPKTLYCLNCGYPLYKIEQPEVVEPEPLREETEPAMETVETVEEPEIEELMTVELPEGEVIEAELEPELEPVVEAEPELEPLVEAEAEELVVEVEEEVLIEVEEAPEAVPELSVEEDYEEVTIEEEPLIVAEPEPEPEPVVELVPEPEPEPEPEPMVELEPEPVLEAEPELAIELEPEPVLEVEPEPEPLVEAEPEVEPMIELEPVIEEAHEVETIEEEPIMEEVVLEYAPDPLTKEVMENLAKNITLKIRLVKLLKEGKVREETFQKLFDSYVEQGRIWVTRRDEIMRRFRADIERMDRELVDSTKAFELLEIRRSIGDASDEEYDIKAPAFKWDMENLDRGVRDRKAGVLYLEHLERLVPEEEVAELEEMSTTQYSAIDEIEEVVSDTIARIKEALAEALNILKE